MSPVATQAVKEYGSRFRTVQSPVVSIPFDAGNTRSVELPRSFLYKYLAFRLSGSVTVGTATGPINESPLGLLRRIDLIADGRKLLWSLGGRDAFRLSQILQGKRGELDGASTGTDPIGATFLIHNEAVRLRLPIDSYFDPRPYEKIELRVQWGTVADLFSTVGTATIAATTSLDVQVVQSAEGAPHILFNRLLLFDEQVITASSSALTFNVPRSGNLHGLLIRVDNAGTPTNDSLNFITLKSDNNFLHIDRLTAATLRARNVIEYSVDGTTTDSGLDGYFFLDLTEDGLMQSALNTFDLNVLQLILDATVPSGSRVYRVTYIYFEPITAA